MTERLLTIEAYAELCACLAGADEASELALAARHGLSAQTWRQTKARYSRQMSDPADGGRTALAFIPAYQAARARVAPAPTPVRKRRRVDDDDDDVPVRPPEPCTLESYIRVLAELAPVARAYADILAAHGFTRETWCVAEAYWSPQIAGVENPRFSAGQATRFRVLVAHELRRGSRRADQ